MLTLIPTLRWITITLWLIWLVVFWNGGWQSVIVANKPDLRQESLKDTLTSVAVTLLTMQIIATGLLLTSGALDKVHGSFSIARIVTGLALTLFGMGGTLYSRNYLVRFWDTGAVSLSGQAEIVRGPYRLVRHPVYLFTILCYTGTALVFPTWWNIVAVLLVMLAYIFKTGEEERFLAENLPGYREYQKSTPHRLVPGVW